MNQAELAAQIGEVRLLPLENNDQNDQTPPKTEGSSFAFMTSFGQVIGDPAVYGPIATMLQQSEGCSIHELQKAAGDSADELPIITSLFLDAGRITFDRGERGIAATSIAQKVNQTVLDLIQTGRSYANVILPRSGTSIEISLVEVLILQAHLQGLKGNMLASCVNLGLESLGVQLLNAHNSPVRSMGEALKLIMQISSVFLKQRLPVMKRLGAFPEDWG